MTLSASHAAVIAVTVVLLVACAEAPTVVVPLAHNEFGEFTLLVYDESGLVAGARAAERQPGGHDEVVAFPERQEIEVGWTGGACSHRPTLAVSGNSAALRLVVRNPYDPQPLPFLPIGCPAVGIRLRVTLSLREPVAPDAVGIEVSL